MIKTAHRTNEHAELVRSVPILSETQFELLLGLGIKLHHNYEKY